MPRPDVALEVNRPDVVQICPRRLPVDRTLVQSGVLAGGGVDGVHVDHRHLLEQDFSLALYQLPRLPVQAGSLQEEPVYVDTLRWGVVDVLPGESCDEILR